VVSAVKSNINFRRARHGTSMSPSPFSHITLETENPCSGPPIKVHIIYNITSEYFTCDQLFKIPTLPHIFCAVCSSSEGSCSYLAGLVGV